MILNSIAQAAADYAELGLAVFPVAADCRSPLTEHGCKDASTDRAVVAGWWARWPAANVSLATGKPSGVFALDVDMKDGKDGLTALASLCRVNGSLTVTWEAATPSGGRHLLFRQPAGRTLRNRVNLPVPGLDQDSGLDVRSTGGSVALAPSTKPGGAYRWLKTPLAVDLAEAPAWLLDLIDPPEAPRAPAPPIRFNSTDRAARYGAAALDREIAALAALSPGAGRNPALFRAAAALGSLIAGGLLPQDYVEAALEDAAVANGLTRKTGVRSVRQTIASGFRHGFANPRDLRMAG